MLTAQSSLLSRKNGFTIVELLIVIVVVAILAAISVVAYTGIQNRAYDTTVQNDLRAAYQTAQRHLAVSGDRYIYGASGEWNEFNTAMDDFNATQSAYTDRINFIYCFNTASQAYGFGALSKSGKSYAIASTGGLRELSSQLSTTGAGAAGACSQIIGVAESDWGWSWGYNSGTWQAWTK